MGLIIGTLMILAFTSTIGSGEGVITLSLYVPYIRLKTGVYLIASSFGSLMNSIGFSITGGGIFFGDRVLCGIISSLHSNPRAIIPVRYILLFLLI